MAVAAAAAIAAAAEEGEEGATAEVPVAAAARAEVPEAEGAVETDSAEVGLEGVAAEAAAVRAEVAAMVAAGSMSKARYALIAFSHLNDQSTDAKGVESTKRSEHVDDTGTWGRAKAWCLPIHAEPSILSLSLSLSLWMTPGRTTNMCG